jgi:hypothetical protein
MSIAGYGYGRDLDAIGSISTYGYSILEIVAINAIANFIYTIVEENRISLVGRENRDCVIENEGRSTSIFIDDRTFVIPKKD